MSHRTGWNKYQSFIVVLVLFNFLEVHLLGPMHYTIMLGALFGFTVIKEITVFFHGVVSALNRWTSFTSNLVSLMPEVQPQPVEQQGNWT